VQSFQETIGGETDTRSFLNTSATEFQNLIRQLLEMFSDFLPEYINELMKLLENSNINIAVFGNTNVGKTTLINKLMGIELLKGSDKRQTKFFW
jgi:ribosome biogenesis GTPase A